MLTLQYIPQQEFKNLTPAGKIKKILELVKEDKIVLVEGRLEPHEETSLIEKTMESVNKSFKGIELCTIKSGDSGGLFNKLRSNIASMLIGSKQGLTIIGPAAIVKEIKRDPNKIQLITENKTRRKRRR